MSPEKHLISGIVLGGVIYAAKENLMAAGLCAAGCVSSDIDHLLEYGIYSIKRKCKPSLKEFLSGQYFVKKGTIVLFLHGYEYALCLRIASVLLGMRNCSGSVYLLSFTGGYASHLIMDLFGNVIGSWGYSFIYRAHMRFREDRLCIKSHLK